MSKTLPPITHLQFLVLDALADTEQAGRDVRELLTTYGIRRSAPAFYQMMARLEASDLVEGWYDQKVVAGQNLKERRYRITRTGLSALTSTRSFYVARAGAGRVAAKGSHA